MVLLFASVVLLVMVAVSFGNFICNRSFRFHQGLFVQMLTGLMSITVVCNLLSFFFPLDYKVAVGFIMVSVLLYKYLFAALLQAKSVANQHGKKLLWLALPVAVVLAAYALLPPQHGDSQGYHFLMAEWMETYKVVPGLANVHGRFGFNSSFFAITAAFSFTGIAGQSLYGVNIVLITGFYGWLLNRIYLHRKTLIGVLYSVVAIYAFRMLLIALNSPTPDAWAAIIVMYVFITTAESLRYKTSHASDKATFIILLCAFALIIKLNTAPLVLLAIILFFYYRLYKSMKRVLFLTLLIAIIIAPWLARNYILSGYFVYPVSFTGFLNPNWKVADELVRFDRLLINNGPKMFSEDWEYMDSLSFVEWLPLWIREHRTVGVLFDFTSLLLSLAAGLLAVVRLWIKKRKQDLVLVLLAYFSVLFWLYHSPDYRFGMPYIISLAVVALHPFTLVKTKYSFVICLCLWMAGLFYTFKAVRLLKEHRVTSYLFFPLRSHEYYRRNDVSTFTRLPLKKGVYLYVDDKEHNCLNAPLPCYQVQADGLSPRMIQMRGETIEEGFKLVK